MSDTLSTLLWYNYRSKYIKSLGLSFQNTKEDMYELCGKEKELDGNAFVVLQNIDSQGRGDKTIKLYYQIWCMIFL